SCISRPSQPPAVLPACNLGRRHCPLRLDRRDITVVCAVAFLERLPRVVVGYALRLILVHPEEDQMPREVSRLRGTADDRPLNVVGDGIRRTEIIGGRIAEEGLQVAERGGACEENV